MALTPLIDVNGEAGAYEALVGNLRLASEAARTGSQINLGKRLRAAISAASELGIRLSDGRWSQAAIMLDSARAHLTKASPKAFRNPAFRSDVADKLAEIRLTLELLRHGRVH